MDLFPNCSEELKRLTKGDFGHLFYFILNEYQTGNKDWFDYVDLAFKYDKHVDLAKQYYFYLKLELHARKDYSMDNWIDNKLESLNK